VDHPAFEVLASRTSKIQDAMLFWADQSAWDYHEIARGHSCGRQHQLIFEAVNESLKLVRMCPGAKNVKVARGGWRRGTDALPFCSKFERPSNPAISVESITETRIARLRSLDRSSQPDPLDLAECDLVLRPVVELSRSWRPAHLLGVFEPSVVLQINRDAGRTPGKTPDECERTRRLGPIPDRWYHLIRSRSLNIARLAPKHGVLFGMTGAGKSVIIADLLAQIGFVSDSA
jgi:hypothetical protein